MAEPPTRAATGANGVIVAGDGDIVAAFSLASIGSPLVMISSSAGIDVRGR